MVVKKEKKNTGTQKSRYKYCVIEHNANKFPQNSINGNSTAIKAVRFMTKTLKATESGKNIRIIKLASDVSGKKYVKIVMNDGKAERVSIPNAECKTVMDCIVKYWLNRKEA